jgi:septal ring-binding cell division protein DamX
MKIKVFELEFDASNLHEVAFVKEVITGSNLNVPATSVVTAPEKEEKPIVEKEIASSPTPQMPVKPKRQKAEDPVNSTSVPTFSEPTQTAAPVQEFKKEANPEAQAIAIAKETIAEVKKEMEKPVKPKAVKEAPQATIEPEPIQAPIEEEKTTEKASNEPPTAKEMQDLVISLIKTGTLGREDVQTIFNEFGGTSLMKIAPAKFALLKQRLTTYNS